MFKALHQLILVARNILYNAKSIILLSPENKNKQDLPGLTVYFAKHSGIFSTAFV
jgi:hypothetical protein